MRGAGFGNVAVLLALVLAPGAVSGQEVYSNFGVGLAVPSGAWADVWGAGYTLRGQAGTAVGPVDAHVQTGYSSFFGETVTVGGVEQTPAELDFFHIGLGVRLGLGPLWVGANGAYFLGDGDDGFGVFPEVGLGIGTFELVLDARVDGTTKWAALRLSWAQ